MVKKVSDYYQLGFIVLTFIINLLLLILLKDNLENINLFQMMSKKHTILFIILCISSCASLILSFIQSFIYHKKGWFCFNKEIVMVISSILLICLIKTCNISKTGSVLLIIYFICLPIILYIIDYLDGVLHAE